MIYKCKYCNRITTSKGGNTFHEKYCSYNPNRIICANKMIGINKDGVYKYINPSELDLYISNGWNKGSCYRFTPSNKNKYCITNGIQNKYINQEELSEWEEKGWRRGNTIKNKCKSSGIAKTHEKEMERRQKISETMKNNPLAGGYRKGSGRSKSGWYKGIYCDSTWELAFLIYHLDNNLYIERCKEKRKYIYKGKEHIYLPDFLTKDGIIEIKGYKSEQWNAKFEQNPDIIVLYSDDIKPYLEYCKNKYQCDIEALYDKDR